MILQILDELMHRERRCRRRYKGEGRGINCWSKND